MAVRCEYCGQLYEGLICPYCCAPRGESVEHIGDNNAINALYADNVPYYVHHDVWPEDEPSERDETIDAICGTCTHDAQVSAKVRELAEEQAKKHRISLRWTVINLICAWFGAFSLGMLIGAPVGFSIVVATVFCTVIGCCIAMEEIYDI